MRNVWINLKKSYLISLIGEDNLEFAENILPDLAKEIGRDYLDFVDITNKKSKLSQLFQATAMSGSILKKDFRQELITYLSPDYKNKLQLSFPDYETFDELKRYICSVPWQKNDVTIKFCNALDISEDVLPNDIKKIPDLETLPERPETQMPFKQLKDYQFLTVAKVYRELENNLSRIMIQMPTGSGKTRVAMEIICEFFLKNKNKNINIVWLANREELLEQAYITFNEVWSHLSDHKIDLVRFFGKTKNRFDDVERSSLAICGLDKLASVFKKKNESLMKYSENVKLVIFDEAHGIIAKTYNETVINLMNSDCSLIGLSATPGRVDSDEQSQLVEKFGNNLIELDCNGINPIVFLKNQSILSQTELELLEITPEIEFDRKELKYIEENFEIPTSALQRLGKEKIRNIEIIKKLKNECESGKKIIFFAIDLDHSKKINAILNFIGIKSTHIDGDTSNRKYILNQFKNDFIQVICNGDLLATGFDAPKIDVVFIARPVGSKGLKLQMIGRGLRGPKLGGTKKCKIIDVRDDFGSSFEAVDIYDSFADYFTNDQLS